MPRVERRVAFLADDFGVAFLTDFLADLAACVAGRALADPRFPFFRFLPPRFLFFWIPGIPRHLTKAPSRERNEKESQNQQNDGGLAGLEAGPPLRCPLDLHGQALPLHQLNNLSCKYSAPSITFITIRTGCVNGVASATPRKWRSFDDDSMHRIT